MRWARGFIFTGLLIGTLIATFIFLGDRFLRLGHGGTLTAVLVCFACATVGVICSLVGIVIGWYTLAKSPGVRTIGNALTIVIGVGSVGAFVFWVWPN